MLLFNALHLHLTFTSAYFKCLVLIVIFHFSPSMQRYCMIMAECSYSLCWSVIAVFVPSSLLLERINLHLPCGVLWSSVLCVLFSLANPCDRTIFLSQMRKN